MGITRSRFQHGFDHDHDCGGNFYDADDNFNDLGQDKKVLVADPDVLSFSVVDHKMQFAGILISIATDMTLIYNIIFFLI